MQFLRGKARKITRLKFCPNSRFLVADGLLWDTFETDPQPWEHELLESPAYSFTRDGRMLFSNSLGFDALNLESREDRTYKLHDEHQASPKCFHPDGERYFVTGDDGFLHVYQLTQDGNDYYSHRVVSQFIPGIQSTKYFDFLNTNGSQYIGYRDVVEEDHPRYTFLYYLDTTSMDILHSCEIGRVDKFSYSDRLAALTYTLNQSIHFIPCEPDFKESRVILIGVTDVIDHAFCPNTDIVGVVQRDSSIGIYSILNGEKLKHYQWNISQAIRLAISPDGTRCAVGNHQGKFLIFDLDIA
ncbi:MAG: hypothetical protein ACRC8S_12660 [Fimbriiglobus sp.]